MTDRVVITNAGPLMALAKLNQLHLLAELYAQVSVPEPVYTEVVTQGLWRGEPDALVVRLFWNQRQWPIVAVTDAQQRSYQPETVLDRGESAVLALGLAMPNLRLCVSAQGAQGAAALQLRPLAHTRRRNPVRRIAYSVGSPAACHTP